MGHTKKIFLKNVTFVKRAWSNCAWKYEAIFMCFVRQNVWQYDSIQFFIALSFLTFELGTFHKLKWTHLCAFWFCNLFISNWIKF
jgi:hypothetical protein